MKSLEVERNDSVNATLSGSYEDISVREIYNGIDNALILSMKLRTLKAGFSFTSSDNTQVSKTYFIILSRESHLGFL